MKTRPPRRAFAIEAVKRRGSRSAMAVARVWAKVLTVAQSAVRRSGTITWTPLPPVTMAPLSSPI